MDQHFVEQFRGRGEWSDPDLYCLFNDPNDGALTPTYTWRNEITGEELATAIDNELLLSTDVTSPLDVIQCTADTDARALKSVSQNSWYR